MKFILKNAEELIAAGFLIITTALVVLNIICRYFFNMGMVWSEEVATGCFVWSVFIGAIACFKRRGHVGVDIVVNMLPATLRRGIATLMDIILVVLNAYMFYLSVVFISKSYTKLTPVMGISSALLYLCCILQAFPLPLPCSAQPLPILPLLIPLLRRICYSKALSEAANPSRCLPSPSLLWRAVL